MVFWLTNLDKSGSFAETGQALMNGLKIDIAEKPGSAIIIYEKAK